MSPSCSRPSPDEDGNPQLSIDICAPYGFYELEIKIAGTNIENHDIYQDIQWQIDAASNKVNNAIPSSLHYTDTLYVS